MHVVLVTYTDWLPELATFDVIIAVDSGIKQFALTKQRCHYWIGEFDSVDNSADYRQFADTVIELPQIKDETDTQAALNFARTQLQATAVTIVTTHSGRFDHQYAQLLLCQWGIDHGIKVEIISPTSYIRVLVPGTYRIAAESYRYLSVFAWQEPVFDLTLTHVAYPLAKYQLTCSDPLGISNEITQQAAQLHFTTGKLLLIQSRD